MEQLLLLLFSTRMTVVLYDAEHGLLAITKFFV